MSFRFNKKNSQNYKSNDDVVKNFRNNYDNKSTKDELIST